MRERGSRVQLHPHSLHGVVPRYQESRRRIWRYRESATRPEGDPAVAVEGGGCSCSVLAVGKRRRFRHSRCCRWYGQGYRGDIGSPCIDVADLEEKRWKAQSALGCPVQVSSGVVFEETVPAVYCVDARMLSFQRSHSHLCSPCL